MLNVSERRAGDVTIIDLHGNIIMGGGSAGLRDTLLRLIAEGRRKILLNFAGVRYIDSSGIGELLSGSAALGREGGQLKLMKLSEKVEEVLTLTSLLSVFETYDDEAEALDSYSGTA